jgi:peptide deformylase
MIHELVEKTNPILTQTMLPFSFNEPPTDPIQLARDLAETMIAKNGIGLAANQIGLPYRVFVMKSNPIICCYNPRIVDASEETIYLDEGCLTFPNYYVKIERPKRIRVRFTQPNGEIMTEIYDGITSRIFQHELDHLNGIVFTSRATLFHREQAERRSKKPAK